MAKEPVRRRSFWIWLAGLVVLVGAVLWLPVVWERRLYRDAEALAGVGSKLLDGSVTEARRKVDPGTSASDVRAALGAPSYASTAEGASLHEIWKYYYADGTLTVNVTDGFVARAGLQYGPPRVPTSARK